MGKWRGQSTLSTGRGAIMNATDDQGRDELRMTGAYGIKACKGMA